MKEIVNRLHENRQIELAKSILESNEYKVTKVEEVKRGRQTVTSVLPELSEYAINSLAGSSKYIKMIYDHNLVKGGIIGYAFPVNSKYFVYLGTENYQHGVEEMRLSISINDSTSEVFQDPEYINPLNYDVEDDELYSGRMHGHTLEDMKDDVDDLLEEAKQKISRYANDTEGSIFSSSDELYRFLKKNKKNINNGFR